MMKIILLIVLSTCFGWAANSQETYTARKGSRFFPGHLHVVITVDSSNLQYQLFNHWYSLSYSQHRDLLVPLNDLEKFNNENDTLNIRILKNKIHLKDKKYKLNRNIKHQKLCASIDKMRKISYAGKLAEGHENVLHFHLYTPEELELPEDQFRRLVKKKLDEKINFGPEDRN